MKLLFMVLVFVVTALSQSTPPVHGICDMPPEFSGTLTQVLLFDGCKNSETNFGQFYYSTQNQRVRYDIADGKTNLGGSPSTYSITVWIDYTNQMEYVLDYSSNTCSSLPYLGPMGSGQLPPNSKYGGALLVGSQPVHEYYFSHTLAGNTYYVEIGLMSGTCLVFNGDFFNATTSGVPQQLLMAESFVNAVPMVPPFVMNIPAQCTQSSRVELSPQNRERLQNIHQALELRASVF